MRINNDRNLPPNRVRRGRAVVIGLGLDDDEGHVRYTQGDAFKLYGGSERAHNEMQKRIVRIKERIAGLGICLDHMTYDQYQEIKSILDSENEDAGAF